jgi:uncharacterized membrane protein YdjX (TVP38/TMEM64 family)
MFLAVATMILVGGVLWGAVTGIYLTLGAFVVGELLRTFWLWLRSRPARRHLNERDPPQL